MKVRDLIARLQEMDPELPVCTWSDSTPQGPRELPESRVDVEEGEYIPQPVTPDWEYVWARYVLIG